MLNYDRNANRKEFKSKSSQAEPQSSSYIKRSADRRDTVEVSGAQRQAETEPIGWRVPHKVDLDTVDGGVRHNLASNMEEKTTPVKTRLFSSNGRKSQKFIWGEQWRNISPWSKKHARNSTKEIKKSFKSTPRNFLNNSKTKILRLVSPKKDNSAHERLELRSIGIQTSGDDLRSFELSSTPQSPPGSYHSPAPQSQQSSTSTQSQSRNDAESQFDFTRTVQSPPRRTPRTSHRKLNFPSVTGATGSDGLQAATMTKTYRSYHSDLDQDVTLSKMGYILSNIRAKLEASDDHALRTFQEIERREQQTAGFDYPDGLTTRRQTRADIHRMTRVIEIEQHSPIYSEIEEDSMHILESQQYDSKTGIQHSPVGKNPEALYAKVNKSRKVRAAPPPPTPLGKILHDSLKNTSILSEQPSLPSLPPLPEPSSSEACYSVVRPPPSPTYSSFTKTMIVQYQSLNNIRVQEHNSPPKKNRNLSKSDLSLQRSDIFLENLCRSEIIIGGRELERLGKMDNQQLRQSMASSPSYELPEARLPLNDTSTSVVSYELPDNGPDADSNTAGSHLDLNSIASPHSRNQSTPNNATEQPQTFVTQRFADEETNHDMDFIINSDNIHYKLENKSRSCPTTLIDLPASNKAANKSYTESLNGLFGRESYKNNKSSQNVSQNENCSFRNRFDRLKSSVQNSFRRSKDFVKSKAKKLSTSLNFSSSPNSTSERCQSQNSSNNSSLNLGVLFELDANEPLSEQLEKAVSICRQLPELEVSPEMVEAERLLLFSSLRRQTWEQKKPLVLPRTLTKHPRLRFFVDTIRLPLKPNVSQDIFFNYFYIVVFECDGFIRSTHSVECHNDEVIFRDCAIEFTRGEGGVQYENESEAQVHCDIFMLRLRKVSTLSLEPKKLVVKIPSVRRPSRSSTSSNEEIVSRFRFHASFELKPSDFVPYEYVEHETKNSDTVCLRAAANSCKIPFTSITKSSNLTNEVVLGARAELRFLKRKHSGFLNVEDPHNQHNWNRRWCTLDGLQVCVWRDVNGSTDQKPLLCLYLHRCMQEAPITGAPPQLCARLRSFCVQCSISKAGEQVATAAVFFAADTQADFTAWLDHLNAVLQFAAQWLK